MLIHLLQELPTNIPSSDSLRVVAAQTIETAITQPDVFLENLISQAIHFGLKVLAAFVIFLIGSWIVKWAKKFIAKTMKRTGNAVLESFINSLVTITLWIIVAIVAIGALGINTTSLAALLAAGGMAIGMAMSGTVQNFAGGIMLLVFKPFKAGDYIEAQGYSGTVTEINIVSTKIITVDNKVVIIPNGALSSGNINNYSSMPLRRVDWTVSVEYGSDVDKVKSLLLQILSENSAILDSKTEGAADPFVALSAMKDSGIDFTVRVWVNSADYWTVYFWGNEVIYTRLPKEGINFPFPHLDVLLRNK